uniref:Uncharacterized protein n=1 Tax=Plectus sambesii TaxID=2011161 RepID=A0A914W161_9BILA
MTTNEMFLLRHDGEEFAFALYDMHLSDLAESNFRPHWHLSPPVASASSVAASKRKGNRPSRLLSNDDPNNNATPVASPSVSSLPQPSERSVQSPGFRWRWSMRAAAGQSPTFSALMDGSPTTPGLPPFSPRAASPRSTAADDMAAVTVAARRTDRGRRRIGRLARAARPARPFFCVFRGAGRVLSINARAPLEERRQNTESQQEPASNHRPCALWPPRKREQKKAPITSDARAPGRSRPPVLCCSVAVRPPPPPPPPPTR